MICTRLFYFKRIQQNNAEVKDEPAERRNTMKEENIYNEIADENDEKVKPSEKETENEEEEIETDQPSDKIPVLTKEDVEEMGLGKGFIGKPITILKDVYKNQDKQFRQMSQSIPELRKEIAELKDLSNKEVKQIKDKAEEKAEDQLGEMPDPVNDFDEYKAWMQKKDELTTKNFEKILTKVLDEKLSGISKSTAELQADKNSQTYFDLVSTELKAMYKDNYTPELVDQVSKEFEDSLKELDEEELEIITQRLNKKPSAIAREVIKNHKALLFGKKSETETNEEKTARIKAEQEKKVNSLKNTSKKFTEAANSSREKAKSDEDDSIYKSMADENEIIAKRES